MILRLVFLLFTLLKVIVQGLHSAYKEPLNGIVWSSFQASWEKNSTYQIQFTSYCDRSVSYEALDVETSLFFDGQEYIVKQCVPSCSGEIETKDVVATHVFNEISRVRQRAVKTGTLTYSVSDVLSFYLQKNAYGFTWEVIGEFEKAQITDLGNSNGQEMLSKIVSTWENAVIYPDNKKIRVFSYESFIKDNGNRLDYMNNCDDVKLSVDSTNLVNQIMVYGKQKEDGSYYFPPHLVTDANSVLKWGLHEGDDLSDERFTNKAAMDSYAKTKLSPEPALTIELKYMDADKPIAGERKRLEIAEKGFMTNVDVLAYTWYPFYSANQTTLTLNNTAKTILDYQRASKNELSKVTTKKVEENVTRALQTATTAYQSRVSGEIIGEV